VYNFAPLASNRIAKNDCFQTLPSPTLSPICKDVGWREIRRKGR